MLTYEMRLAMPSEINTVMDLLTARVTWLQERGSDQWSTYARWRPEMVEAIRLGHVWLLERLADQRPVGTVTVSHQADPDFWTEDEQQTPALYLGKLATDPEEAGQDIGGVILRWSLYWAVRTGAEEVRFDVWRTATDLHRYYQRQGWTYLRTVEVPNRFSGALFTRRAEVVPNPELLHDGYTDNPLIR